MTKSLNLLIIFLASGTLSFAQHFEKSLDFRKAASTASARYRQKSDRNGSRWQHTLYYIPEGTVAQSGNYLDSTLARPDGEVLEFYPDGVRKSRMYFKEGLQHGPETGYAEDGCLHDSAFYKTGHLTGSSLVWDKTGRVTDSAFFDGAGNGHVFSWHENGQLRQEGWKAGDTVSVGTWNHFHPNGKPLAQETFLNGKTAQCRCYDSLGVEKPAEECALREAEFPGGSKGWIRFLQNNMKPARNAAAGTYTVYIRFIVEKNGRLSNFQALTNWGKEFEPEVLRMLKLSPRWVPARQFGREVKAYRTQPVTFMISD